MPIVLDLTMILMTLKCKCIEKRGCRRSKLQLIPSPRRAWRIPRKELLDASLFLHSSSKKRKQASAERSPEGSSSSCTFSFQLLNAFFTLDSCECHAVRARGRERHFFSIHRGWYTYQPGLPCFIIIFFLGSRRARERARWQMAHCYWAAGKIV